MNVLLVLPIIIPLITAAVSLIAQGRRSVQCGLGIVGAGALVVASLALMDAVLQSPLHILSVQIGNWPAPFGITLVADLFSAIMVILAAVTGFAVALYSIVGVDAHRQSFGYYPLLNVLLMGVCGAFLTGDIFNLYVWFEVMLIASFVLLALGGERAQLEGALKYVTLNLVSSSLFLAGVGILYGAVGTLNMADLSVKLAEMDQPGVELGLAMLFLLAFGIKAAMFPLFFWLPSSYHTPPIAVSAVFAGLLTKVGVYALIRVFTLLFVQNIEYTHALLLALSGLTMVTGVLGAVAQNEFRRILSFHIISQIGYMIMGLGLYTPLALAGSVLYIIHHIIVKTNLFLISGIAYRICGTHELKKMGGLYRSFPALGVLFLIPALSLAGIPPLSGFFAKLTLVKSGLAIEHYAIVATALAVSLLTLFSMTKIWAEAFWKPMPADDVLPNGSAGGAGTKVPGLIPLAIPALLLAGMTISIGIWAEPIFQLSMETAEQLLDPSAYIETVLGKTP